MTNGNILKNPISLGLLGLGSILIFCNKDTSIKILLFLVKYFIPLHIIIFVLGLGIVYLIQNKLIYLNYASNQTSNLCQNNLPGFKNPKERGMQYKEVEINTSDNVKIKGWFILQSNSRECNTLLYFHGSAANRGFRMDRISMFYFTLGLNILIIDYRGYADSEGSPTEEGIQRDAEAVFEYALDSPYINQKKIVIYGKSIGGAVAIYLAHKMQEKVLAVIIENTFTTLKEESGYLLPYLKSFGFLMKNFWPSVSLIPKISRPILVLYGENDEIVDNKFSSILFEKATSSIYKEIHCIPEGDHNNCHIHGRYLYLSIFKEFLSKVNKDFSLQLNSYSQEQKCYQYCK